jgi:hypothetical protein
MHHRDCSIHTEGANMQCSRSFDMGLTSADGKKLECFKWTAKYIFISVMKILHTHFVVKSQHYFISPKLYLCVDYNLHA